MRTATHSKKTFVPWVLSNAKKIVLFHTFLLWKKSLSHACVYLSHHSDKFCLVLNNKSLKMLKITLSFISNIHHTETVQLLNCKIFFFSHVNVKYNTDISFIYGYNKQYFSYMYYTYWPHKLTELLNQLLWVGSILLAI